MKLTKVKGIVIKETSYKDNDKIITILSDELGKVSVMAKGAKRLIVQILQVHSILYIVSLFCIKVQIIII